MKQPNPFKDEKSPARAPRYYSGSNPLERETHRPAAPKKAPQDRKVPISQRGGG